MIALYCARMPSIDSIVTRLLALHPKLIDLSLDRMWRLLGGDRSSGTQAAAGHPCRRHQRQGLDHRVHARDPRGGGLARACLYLAASRPLQRALPSRPGGRGRAGVGRRACGRVRGMRARQCRRADHRVRDHHRGRAVAVRTPSRRRAAARSRARRPARRDQRGRCSRWPRSSRRSRSITPTISATASQRSRPRRPASSSATCRRSSPRSRARRSR